MRGKAGSGYGWGVNDIVYPVTQSKTVGGKSKQVWICPYYKTWRSMLCRCLSDNYKSSYETYKECSVVEDWKYLSNFVKWVDSQPNKDWKICALDKDILVRDNKIYSPETCIFTTANINRFVIDSNKTRGQFLLGVCPNRSGSRNAYQVYCNNPYTRKQEYLGVFNDELKAHKIWQAKKHEYACLLAHEQTDPRVAKALKERYAPDKDWTNK
mgnify:FL=1